MFEDGGIPSKIRASRPWRAVGLGTIKFTERAKQAVSIFQALDLINEQRAPIFAAKIF